MLYRRNGINANSFKANSLVNTAIEDCTIKDLGIVVLDELHMIDDDHRGYIMELMASKLLSLEYTVQIVGMSATLTVLSTLDCMQRLEVLTPSEYSSFGTVARCVCFESGTPI